MEVRTRVQDFLLSCENINFCIEVVDSKTDEEPYLLTIEYDGDTLVDYWMREEDLTSMVRIINRARKERKRMIGG